MCNVLANVLIAKRVNLGSAWAHDIVGWRNVLRRAVDVFVSLSNRK